MRDLNLLAIHLFTRRIVGFGIERADIDGVAVCRMFNCAIAGQPLPKHISTDHDPLFRFHRWLANLRVLEVDEIKTVPNVPVSHPFVERLIGTIRGEFLDHTFFWSTLDLERKLQEFKHYYNDSRVHHSLDGSTPAGRPASHVLAAPRLIHSDGASIAGDFSRRQLPLEYQFAMHRLFSFFRLPMTPAVGGASYD